MLKFLATISQILILSIFLPISNVGAYMPNSNAKRSEVPKKYQWQPENIFSSDNKWEEAYKKTLKEIPNILKFKGKLDKSSKNLLSCLENGQKLSIAVTNIYVYAMYKSNVEVTRPKEKSMYDKAQMLATEYAKALAFVEPEILKMSSSKIKKFIKKDKRLEKYNHYFDRLLKKKDHILSDKEEALLAKAGNLMSKPTDIFESFKTNVRFPEIKDEKGKRIRLNFTNFSQFRESNSRRVRKMNAFKFFGTLNTYLQTFNATLDFAVKRDVFIAHARNYKSALDAAMSENYFPASIYENLINTISENLSKSLHKYIELRRKVMKLKTVYFYDLYNPLVSSYKKKYTYEAGRQEISKALKPLGEDYVKAFQMGSNPQNGWVDIFPNKNKHDGAYASGVWGIHPYILLNHQETLNDVSTIAHEFGHALHYYFAEQQQPYTYHDPETMSTETAAILNEELLLNHLLKKAKTKKEKLYLLNRRLENIRGTFFRQTMFAEFEKKIHENVEAKVPLTGEALNKIYAGLVKKYYGPSFTLSENDGVEWAYIPHFYYDFYVWKYAAGIAAAEAFVHKMAKGDKKAAQDYIKYLESGSSDYTVNLLKKAGIDLTKKETIMYVINVFRKTVDEFEKVYFGK